MLSRFCRKELIVTRLAWMIALPFYLVFAPIFFMGNTGYLTGHLLFAFAMCLVGAGLDDYFDADAVICSLPVKRSSVVVGRYLAFLLVALIVLFLCIAYGYFLDANLTRPGKVDLEQVASIPGALAYLVPMAIISSLFLPFYFRFGFGRGLFFFSFSVVILAIAAIALVDPAAMTVDLLRDPCARLVRVIVDLRESAGTGAVITAALIAAAAPVYLSIKLSVNFYDKREF